MDQNWWQHAVIYQIYPRSFYDSNGDGIGDLQGITSKLDYLDTLNLDALWISPFYSSPMADFGYDVTDFCSVDPRFGNLDDFKQLLAEAHDRGLKVLLDQVWCHTSDQHPWFIESRSSRDNPRADWFVWADANEQGECPNNWLATFGGSAWEWCGVRKQFYLHHFLPQQPALNWYNPEVQQAMLDVGRFWLDMGVDGFRFDVINFLMHDRQLRDNPERKESDHLPVGGSRKIPFFRYINRYNISQTKTFEMIRNIRKLLNQYPGVTSLAEISSAEDALSDSTQAVGPQHLHMAYNSSLMTERSLTAGHLREVLEEAASLLQQGGLCWTAGTHDFPRLASRWHGDLLTDRFDQEAFNYLLAVLLLTLPGSCCIYQGDELGLPEAQLAYEHLQDPYGKNNYPELAGRDGCRTPIPWDSDLVNHGFSSGANTWLPAVIEHRDMAVSVQWDKPMSLLNKYRRLLAWRRMQPGLRESLDIQILETEPRLLGYIRGQDTHDPLLFLLNFSSEIVHQDLSKLPRNSLLGHSDFSKPRQFDDIIEMQPYGVYIAACTPGSV